MGLLFGWGSSSALFMATALTATSVGITVRALRELGHSERRAVRIILAAAVLDDVLGLIVLVVVSGTTSGSIDAWNLALLIVEAIAYVGLIGFFGPRLVVRLRDWLKDLNVSILFEIGVVLTLALSLLADYIGLAAIVGAFIAGLTMSELKQHTDIERRFEPLAWFFTPFFFVLMGTYLDFGAFAKPSVLLAVAVFTALAVVTKYLGGWIGARNEGPQVAREVGVGMTPRGEVGIVVAGFALAEGAIGDDVYAAILGMVLATTILAPFLIKAVFGRDDGVGEHTPRRLRLAPGRPGGRSQAPGACRGRALAGSHAPSRSHTSRPPAARAGGRSPQSDRRRSRLRQHAGVAQRADAPALRQQARRCAPTSRSSSPSAGSSATGSRPSSSRVSCVLDRPLQVPPLHARERAGTPAAGPAPRAPPRSRPGAGRADALSRRRTLGVDQVRDGGPAAAS